MPKKNTEGGKERVKRLTVEELQGNFETMMNYVYSKFSEYGKTWLAYRRRPKEGTIF